MLQVLTPQIVRFASPALCAAAALMTFPAALQAAPAQAAKPAAPALDAGDLRVARALENVLRSTVSSPGGHLKIQVQPTARSSAGYFAAVTVSARPARVRKVMISELELNARNVRIDVQQLLFHNKLRTISSQTKLRAVITEDDVTKLLARGKRSRGMGLRARFNPDGTARVTGNLNYGLISGPVSGLAKLRVTPDYKVNLDVLSLQLRGAEAPAFLRNQLMGRVNPVIDYEDVPFRPRLGSLVIQGPRAILRA